MAADQSRSPPGSGGPSLTRRNLLKTGAGAATAGAFVAADGPLDPRLDPVGDANGLAITTAIAAGVVAGSTVGYGFGLSLQDYDDLVYAQIDRSIAIAHDAAVSEMQSYGSMETMYRNDLETTDTMAHMEARHAIATAWESGKSSGDAYQDALSAIERYYAERVENNWVIGTAKSVTQQAYAFQAAIEAAVDGGASRDINDEDTGGWALGLVEHPTHGTCSWSELLETRQDIDVELLDGSTVTVPLPDILLEWDGAGISETVNLIDFLRGWDDSAGNFGVQIDGERATWDGHLGIPSWTFTDEDGNTTDTLQSYRVLDFQGQYRSIRTAVENQSATVVGNYSQNFVEDLYVRLDDGEITPSDIRGIDGQAEFLAGTQDASADSYRLSLLQQLDMEQGDMSKIASMTASYSGWEGVKVQRDDSGNRQIFPDRKVEDVEYSGQLFARDIPDGGLNTGATYVADPTVYSASDDQTTLAIDPGTGSQMASHSPHTDQIKEVGVSPDATTIYTSSNDSSVVAIDATTGEALWTFDGPADAVTDLAVSPDGTVYAGDGTGGNLYALDPADGSTKWTYTQHQPDAIAVSPDGGTVAVGGFYTNELHAINAEDGSQKWTNTDQTAGTQGIVVTADGGSVIHSWMDTNENIESFNISDGSRNWSVTGIPALALSRDHSGDIIAGTSSPSLEILDPLDGSVKSTLGLSDSNPQSVSAVGNFLTAVLSDGSVVAFKAGSQSFNKTLHSGNGQGVSVAYNAEVRPDLSVGGLITGARFFDAIDSKEADLRNGLLTMTAMSNQDGDPIDETSGEDWGPPEYDSIDLTGWIDYLETAESIRETIEQYIDDSSGVTGGTTGGSWWDQFIRFLTNMVPFSGALQWVVIGFGALLGVKLFTD